MLMFQFAMLPKSTEKPSKDLILTDKNPAQPQCFVQSSVKSPSFTVKGTHSPRIRGINCDLAASRSCVLDRLWNRAGLMKLERSKWGTPSSNGRSPCCQFWDGKDPLTCHYWDNHVKFMLRHFEVVRHALERCFWANSSNTRICGIPFWKFNSLLWKVTVSRKNKICKMSHGFHSFVRFLRVSQF